MHINGITRVVSLEKYIGSLKSRQLYFGVKVTKNNLNIVSNIGFETFEEGNSILPNPKLSLYARYNLYGKEIIDRSEREQVEREIPYKVHDWHGNLHTGTYHKIYDRFKRKIVSNYNFEFSSIVINGESYLIVPKLLKNDDENKDEICFILNLFLSIFGEVYVLDEKLDLIQSKKYKRVSWKILPIGEKPFEAIKSIIEQKYSEKYKQEPILKRQEFLESLKPNEIYSGVGGFGEYLVYLYPKNNIAVLESISYGNAIYIFDISKWVDLSKKSKKEILDGGLEKERILHHEKYFNKVKKYFL